MDSVCSIKKRKCDPQWVCEHTESNRHPFKMMPPIYQCGRKYTHSRTHEGIRNVPVMPTVLRWMNVVVDDRL